MAAATLYVTAFFFAWVQSLRGALILLITLSLVGVLFAIYHHFGIGESRVVCISIGMAWVTTLWLYGTMILEFGDLSTQEGRERVPGWYKDLNVISLALVSTSLLWAQGVLVRVLTALPVSMAALMAFLCLPIVGMTVGFAPAWIIGTIIRIRGGVADRFEDHVLLFGLSVTASFCISLVAMSLGHALEPAAPIPQTVHVLWSNVLFDGLTVVASLYLLERALQSTSRLFSVPVAVVVNVVIAACLALLSVWVGVPSVGIRQAARIMVGLSPSSGRWEFGPYFWAMHTVFVPMLLFFGMVAICWAGKMSILYTEWFSERAMDHEINPLKMTAQFLNRLSAGLALAAALVAFVLQLIQ